MGKNGKAFGQGLGWEKTREKKAKFWGDLTYRKKLCSGYVHGVVLVGHLVMISLLFTDPRIVSILSDMFYRISLRISQSLYFWLSVVSML